MFESPHHYKNNLQRAVTIEVLAVLEAHQYGHPIRK